MIVIPAVDLRDGKCVQLVGGAYEQERVRMDNPVEVARGWARLGFHRLHVVDLDAATERGDNADLVQDILREVDAGIQVGGGVRDIAHVDRLVMGGAERVVVGTRAIEDPGWLDEVASVFPGRLIVAADVRGRRLATHGWSRTMAWDIASVIESLNDYDLAGVLVTAVHREGQLAGTDLFLMEEVAELSAHPVIASGGIASLYGLRELADRGVAGAVVGMALYTGVLDGRTVAEEFAE
ncbi:MAG: HisA/HisF-related TIM barrel protein [Gemmatimonadaceae bacterium]